jgi:hypothetical protein
VDKLVGYVNAIAETRPSSAILHTGETFQNGLRNASERYIQADAVVPLCFSMQELTHDGFTISFTKEPRFGLSKVG